MCRKYYSKSNRNVFFNLQDDSYTSSLLKLCNTWAYFNHFMLTYNDAYKSPLTGEVDTFLQAVDLSLFFPQLSTNEWGTLWSNINRNKDSSSASFLVKIVVTSCFA